MLSLFGVFLITDAKLHNRPGISKNHSGIFIKITAVGTHALTAAVNILVKLYEKCTVMIFQ